ncbi:putative mandelate racemase / muconate lactonizing enzyme [Klebsiella pneumoniae]|uniref:Putative mandelate racemase / muconate lactonizing enzyme n=1 Tax=Klebsiella pneumoniae TaxID=573 RepID=A0A378G0R6_KLEPN|nr:putative mandelate racemase / muconate lactonizing enzyme [Klebsiella pneumoniae]
MDIKACAAVREAVGPDIDLMIDGYHWYSRAEALWIGKELEKTQFRLV